MAMAANRAFGTSNSKDLEFKHAREAEKKSWLSLVAQFPTVAFAASLADETRQIKKIMTRCRLISPSRFGNEMFIRSREEHKG